MSQMKREMEMKRKGAAGKEDGVDLDDRYFCAFCSGRLDFDGGRRVRRCGCFHATRRGQYQCRWRTLEACRLAGLQEGSRHDALRVELAVVMLVRRERAAANDVLSGD